MQNIIEAVDKKLLQKELSSDKFVRATNNGNNEIYIVTGDNSPNVMREIGRLREITFREAGGGTGKELDVDKYDVGPDSYKQLVLWCPEEKALIGGYRFVLCKNAIDSSGELNLATQSLYNFSDNFIKNYLPQTIELGRSFVQSKYQTTGSRGKGIYALDNLWDGLGALMVDNPDMKYFFGKVTMYVHFNTEARDLILCFLKKFFPDNDNLLAPLNPLCLKTEESILVEKFEGLSYKEAYKVLFKEVKSLEEHIPPLLNAYMNLSSTMCSFGTVVNDAFGGVEETGILIAIDDIDPKKKERHISSYKCK